MSIFYIQFQKLKDILNPKPWGRWKCIAFWKPLLVLADIQPSESNGASMTHWIPYELRSCKLDIFSFKHELFSMRYSQAKSTVSQKQLSSWGEFFPLASGCWHGRSPGKMSLHLTELDALYLGKESKLTLPWSWKGPRTLYADFTAKLSKARFEAHVKQMACVNGSRRNPFSGKCMNWQREERGWLKLCSFTCK